MAPPFFTGKGDIIMRRSPLLLLLSLLLWSAALPLQAAGAQDHVYLPTVSGPVLTSLAHPVTSDEAALLALPSGYSLAAHPGSVPTYSDGSPATLSLSLETEVTPPWPVPGGYPLVSGITHFGPANFFFAGPLTVHLPVQPVDDMADLGIIRHRPGGDGWYRSVTMQFNPNDRSSVEATFFDLGYVPAALLGPLEASAAGTGAGAIYIPTTRCPKDTTGYECFYYFTVKQADLTYTNVPLVGWVIRTAAGPTAESPVPTIQTLPQGQYTFCLSALEAPLTLTYLRKWINPTPIQVNVNQMYHCLLGEPCTGAVKIEPQNLDGWVPADDNHPCAWGFVNPDDPAHLGQTGDFQVTLTWLNTESSATDLDLHLYGPNNLHLYYNSKQSADGSLYLDRDWQRETGNAIENIFQTKDGSGKSIPMPSGAYGLRLVHYSGADNKPYQVRVIHDGTVRTFSGNATSGMDLKLLDFTVP
jgi:hypothetical protein